jgi:hypothetical protein
MAMPRLSELVLPSRRAQRLMNPSPAGEGFILDDFALCKRQHLRRSEKKFSRG